MGRMAFMTEEMKKNLITKYTQRINEAMLYDKQIAPNPEFKKLKAYINLVFDPIAFLKMYCMVQNNQCEVGWNGVVDKLGKGKYRVSDILIYPQVVSGVTVESDDNKMPMWYFGLGADTSNRLKLQGHSHVDMGVTPSPKDIKNQYETAQQLKKGFYIFMIMNKRNQCFFKIIDLEDNMIYDSEDVTVSIEGDAFSSEVWQSELIGKMTNHSFKYNVIEEEDDVLGELPWPVSEKGVSYGSF